VEGGGGEGSPKKLRVREGSTREGNTGRVRKFEGFREDARTQEGPRALGAVTKEIRVRKKGSYRKGKGDAVGGDS